MNSAAFQVDTAFARGMRQLFADLEARLELTEPITVYLAGGMAVHLYTGKRVTNDVDAEFAARVLIPSDLMVEVSDEDGQPRAVYFDTNYNPMFSLLHEDYQRDAIDMPLGLENIRLRVLCPVDLAVSKIARFAPNDQEDIADLIRLGLATADAIETRGRQALSGYIGNTTMVEFNLRDAVALAHQAERERALEHELGDQVRFMRRFDSIDREVNARFDLRNPTRKTLIVSFLEQGRISKRRRAQFADEIPDRVMDDIEAVCSHALAEADEDEAPPAPAVQGPGLR